MLIRIGATSKGNQKFYFQNHQTGQAAETFKPKTEDFFLNSTGLDKPKNTTLYHINSIGHA